MDATYFYVKDNGISGKKAVYIKFRWLQGCIRCFYVGESESAKCYKRINKGRRVYPSVQSLEKCMYLATTMITEKWTQPYHNWGAIISEFRIFFEDRI